MFRSYQKNTLPDCQCWIISCCTTHRQRKYFPLPVIVQTTILNVRYIRLHTPDIYINPAEIPFNGGFFFCSSCWLYFLSTFSLKSISDWLCKLGIPKNHFGENLLFDQIIVENCVKLREIVRRASCPGRVQTCSESSNSVN